MPNSAFNEYILFLDEINSFLHYITHSNTLDNILKRVYELLKRMVNNCHKVIMSDAHIKNNAIYFIENRKGKTIYVKHKFKKHEGINAYFVKDEDMF